MSNLTSDELQNQITVMTDEIQTVKSRNGQYLYNPKNDRALLLSEGNPNEFLDDEVSTEFRRGHVKLLRRYELNVAGIRIHINKIQDLLDAYHALLEMPWLLTISLICQSLVLLYIAKFENSLTTVWQHMTLLNDFGWIILTYTIGLIIVVIHEFGHIANYQFHTGCKQMFWGIELRFYFLLMYYTSVPFVGFLNKKSQLEVVMGGVRSQALLGLMLSVLGVAFSDNIIVVLFLADNLLIMLTNLLPVMRLDGYWAINIKLNLNDYVSDFWSDIKQRKLPKVSITCLVLFNYLVILFSFCSFVYGIFVFITG